jgi:chromosome segregation ATPase
MNASEMIRRLQQENQVLREKNADLERENAALRQLITEMGEQFTGLQGELPGADERIAELERGREGPPGLVKANKPKREGEKEPRRARAKEANHGRKRAEVVTRREEHHITRCPACDCALCKERVAWSREVLELPPPQAIMSMSQKKWELGR